MSKVDPKLVHGWVNLTGEEKQKLTEEAQRMLFEWEMAEALPMIDEKARHVDCDCMDCRPWTT